jgi:hypothetical protein
MLGVTGFRNCKNGVTVQKPLNNTAQTLYNVLKR